MFWELSLSLSLTLQSFLSWMYVRSLYPEDIFHWRILILCDVITFNGFISCSPHFLSQSVYVWSFCLWENNRIFSVLFPLHFARPHSEILVLFHAFCFVCVVFAKQCKKNQYFLALLNKFYFIWLFYVIFILLYIFCCYFLRFFYSSFKAWRQMYVYTPKAQKFVRWMEIGNVWIFCCLFVIKRGVFRLACTYIYTYVSRKWLFFSPKLTRELSIDS